MADDAEEQAVRRGRGRHHARRREHMGAKEKRCKDGLDKVNVMTNEHAQITDQLR
ncbi:hypothetical protein PybrP1_007010 [[Pythium] brassicae (nom. inval.)]|nr:hypothetical protein PybrP1_007010 [[Pythium] brassicae (nom. inval.)]